MSLKRPSAGPSWPLVLCSHALSLGRAWRSSAPGRSCLLVVDPPQGRPSCLPPPEIRPALLRLDPLEGRPPSPDPHQTRSCWGRSTGTGIWPRFRAPLGQRVGSGAWGANREKRCLLSTTWWWNLSPLCQPARTLTVCSCGDSMRSCGRAPADASNCQLQR
jgi:hypothetical protein